MTRIILMSGKGGVGKTTMAAATALASARRGYRTLVISFDLAHSLFDSFDLERTLFDHNKGLPVRVLDRLEVQEIDVQEEVRRHWGEVYRYMAMLLSSSGLSDVVAEEVAILPGMEDVIALMHINQYIADQSFDVIILDCPPTSESLRFVNITATVEWYMLRRFKIDRALVKVARPLANRLSDYQLPTDEYFESLRQIFEKIDGVDRLLVDSQTTSVRLVTNAEKMVIRETQRAYMYFNLYGVTTDKVIVNRLLPAGESGYLASWSKSQAAYAEEIREYFEPVPVVTLPLLPQEVLGIDRLQEVADLLYPEGEDPAAVQRTAPPFQFIKEDGHYAVKFDLPFAEKSEIEVNRHGEDLIVRVGSFKRHVPLPRAIVRSPVASAQRTGDQLIVRFSTGEREP